MVFLFVLMDSVLSAPFVPPIDQNAVYPVVNVETEQHIISKNGLSAIFKMRLRSWSDGSNITVFVLNDDNPLHKQFCKQILNVFPHQMRRYWNKLVFSGTGQAPIELENKDAMINKLINTPGAIGYLKGTDLNHNNIRILNIE
ncbi:MAG: hypothetical protein ACU84H_07600 [Gammaproteobacteria bacterium]